MISAPKNIYGPNLFEIFVHEYGGPKRVAKHLDVTERTVWRWLSEGTAPKMAVLSLYWETQYGRSMIDVEHLAEINLMRLHIRILEKQFAQAQRVIAGMKKLDFGTSNEPFFEDLQEFRITGSEVSASETDRSAPAATRELGPRDQARKLEMKKRQDQSEGMSPAQRARRAQHAAARNQKLLKRQGTR